MYYLHSWFLHLQLFREEKITFEQAADLLMIPKIEFIYLLHELKVPYFSPLLEKMEKEIDVPKVSEIPLDLDDLLQVIIEHNASDLHLKVGSPPVARLEGELVPIGEQPLSKNDTKRLVLGSMNENFGTSPIFTIIVSFFGIFSGLISVVKMFSHIQEMEDSKDNSKK